MRDIPVLAGCSAGCYTREEALEGLKDIAQDLLEVMEEYGDPLPADATAESQSLSEQVAIVTL